MNLPQFLAFKKALKHELSAALRLYNSPVKGKTLPQYLGDLVGKDSALSTDPEVSNLEIAKTTARAAELQRDLKDAAEKTVTLWRYQACREPNFAEIVGKVLEKKEQFAELIEEMKQLIEVVQDVKLGLRRQSNAKRRQDNYKVSKFVKTFVDGGFPDELAKLFAKNNPPAEDDTGRFGGIAAYDANLAALAILKDGSTWDVWQYLQKYASDHDSAISADTLKLVSQMKMSSVMKPLHHKQSEVGIDSVELEVALDSETHRPWLIVASNFSNTWGPMRWPLVGVPCVIMAMDTWVLLAIVSIETLLGKGLGVDSQDLWGGERRIGEAEVSVVALKAKEGINVPLGHAVIWAAVPQSGGLTKEDKKSCGKLLVQWCLHKQAKGEQAVMREVKHATTKILDANTNTKPWSAYSEVLKQWMSAWP